MVAERVLDRRTVSEIRSLETRVRHDEDRAFAGQVRTHANRIHLAVVAERPDLADQTAGALAVLADRRLRQLDGDAA